MTDRLHIRDLDILRDVEKIHAIAHEQRLAILGLLTRGRFTGAMIAGRIGLPTNRVHYHLRRLVDLDLVKEVDAEHKRRATERYYTAAARHFIVDPGIGIQDPGMIAALDSSLMSMLLDWRRAAVLNIDVGAIARRLVLDCARVREGETVLVMYGRFANELGEAVLIEVDALGARPIVKPWSANWLLGTLDRHSAETLAERPFVSPEVDAGLDAVILLSTNVPEGPSPTPEQRQKLPALLESVSRWQRDVYRRGLRHVEFGLPFRGEFEHGRVSTEDGATIFWKAVMTDLDAVGQLGGRLHERIAADPALTLRCPRGTELSLALDAESVGVSDGVISSADVRARRSYETMPAGSLFAVPVPESVEGTFVADYTFAGGVAVPGPRIRVEKGRIVEVDAATAEGALYLRELLAGASGDGNLVASLAFGLNPAGRGPTGKTMLDRCLEGTVTLEFGNNEIIGGNVRSTLNLTFPSTVMSVRSRRQPLVAGGVFVWETDVDGPKPARYARSGLGAADVERIARELAGLLERERPYLDPGLRLADLAGALAVSTGHLSQVLHQGVRGTFSDLVNRHRVAEFKRRVRDPANRRLTYLAIALDSGFPSKASFYRIFKQHTGRTPAEYVAEVRGDEAGGK